MKHDIAEKDGTVVGFAEVLEDKDLSITFHNVWVGVFSTFEAWNCQHGGAYMLVVDATHLLDFELIDVSLIEEDMGDVDDHIKITHSDDDYDYGYIQWDTCNLKDD